MLTAKQINMRIESIMRMPSFRGQKFLLDCLMELASYKVAEEQGMLMRADGEPIATGQSRRASEPGRRVRRYWIVNRNPTHSTGLQDENMRRAYGERKEEQDDI